MGSASCIQLEEDAHCSVVREAAQSTIESIVAEDLHLQVILSSVEEVLRWIVESNVHSVIVHNVVCFGVHSWL